MAWLIRLAAVFGAIAIVALGAAMVISEARCVDLLAIGDSPAVVAAESRDLLPAVRGMYAQEVGAVGLIMPLAAPRRLVSIHGRTATLEIAHGMDEGNRMYASAWREVYRRYHGGDPCVSLRLVWPSGEMQQPCCRSDL
jgi:hypothetical protein